MTQTPAVFKQWHSPHPDQVGRNHLEFLDILGAPTWITITGKDPSRRRVIVTLLHGNEPSGLKAVHKLLQSTKQPATNLGIFVASVHAAQHPPLLSHRWLPGEEDFNRCFNPPYTTAQRQLARAILDKLRDFEPEAIVDTHNTSGHSLPFAVSIRDDILSCQLAQMFTHRLVVIDQALGTLIEQRQGHCPIVTVEFGGFSDPNADKLAEQTLRTFIMQEDLFAADPVPLQILKHPVRLELEAGHKIHYSSTVQAAADITLFNTIDQLNFSRLEPGTALGWLGKSGLKGLRVNSATGEDLTNAYFVEANGFLTTRQAITLFMATTDPFVAETDCLLYLTPALTTTATTTLTSSLTTGNL